MMSAEYNNNSIISNFSYNIYVNRKIEYKIISLNLSNI